MLTLSPEARAYALDKGGIMFLEFIVVGDCCIPYQPEPSVGWASLTTRTNTFWKKSTG